MNWELRLLSKLVALDTDSAKKSNYAECAELVRQEAEMSGFDATVCDAVKFAEDGKPRPNVVVDLEGLESVKHTIYNLCANWEDV